MSTKIEWTDETWNPITGCGPPDYSEACSRCYARRMANRLRGRHGYPSSEPFRVTFHPDHIDKPLHWRKPRRIFVCSMGDLLHEDVKSEWLKQIIEVFQACQEHTFMILTKRPANFGRLPLRESWWPLPNVWLGVTAENQARADKRIPVLLDTPAAVRFVSIEPMLSSVNLEIVPCPACNHSGYIVITWNENMRCSRCNGRRFLWPDWIICGAETGPGKRPMEICAATHLRDACIEAEVPFFFKRDSNGNRELDGKIWDEFPE